MPTRIPRRDAEAESVKISFLTDKARRDALDAVATSMDRYRSYVLNEAVAAYLVVPAKTPQCRRRNGLQLKLLA